MSFLKRVLGDPNEKELRRIRPIVDEINDLEPEIAAMTDDEMRARTAHFREQLAACEDQDEQDAILEEILPEAFALVREAGKRTIGMRHYDVQLIGGIVLHQGKIAEMGTGEGKTLVATLPSYLNALTGRGVHIVTVNDYLARRDSEWMGSIHRFLGLTVGCILSGPENQDPVMKRAQYACDITYGTNNEFGFDYLRDNMVGTLDNMVQRQLNYAIVDEVDNILIDEARTPLIISAPSTESADTYIRFARVVPILKEGVDYEVDLKTRTVAINDGGIDKVEAALGIKDLYADMNLIRYLENALKAFATMQKDKDYIVTNGEVIIIDEHTGRQMIGRRYNEGLHQAIEAKERVPIQAENRTVATITFQNYFRLYRKLAGMTGTALTEAQEFDKIYKLDVIVIPTNRQRVRKDETDLIFKTEEAKYKAVVEEIKQRHEVGQPLLVGTTSVENSERLSRMLDREEIAHQTLNAKYHQREAEIVAQAGRLGAVTISTNMAGRGTDILLGGNPEGMVDDILHEREIDREFATEADLAEALEEARQRCKQERDQVLELGGLHVIGTERHDSRRIDNQLRGRSGRQGDPGSTRFYVSLEDELMRRFGGERVASMMNFFKLEDDVPIESGMAGRMIEQAQQKVEAWYFDMRKHVVEYDDVIARQREVIYDDRRQILSGEGLHERILDIIAEEVDDQVARHLTGNLPENWDLDAVNAFFDHWHISLPEDFFPENINTLKRTAFLQSCIEWAQQHYEQKQERITEQLRKLGHPNPEEQAADLMTYVEKDRMLRVVDALWMDHIDAIDELRSSIGLRGIAQSDPLVEFKREAFTSFDDLKNQIRHYVADNVMLSEVQINVAPPAAPEPPPQLQTNTDAIAQASGQSKTSAPVAQPVAPPARPTPPKKVLTQTKTASQGKKSGTPSRPLTVAEKTATRTPSRPLNGQKVMQDVPVVSPNDPCPCGSKQKYKFCHGAGKK